MASARILALLLAFTTSVAGAEDDADEAKPASAAQEFSHGLIELKRLATAHGTPEEATKINLKFDYFPQDDAVSLLRLELPFPDDKTTFAGSPFDPTSVTRRSASVSAHSRWRRSPSPRSWN
jgi:hypothetical protein